MLSHKELHRLANGSDIRGVATPDILDEPVTLTEEAVHRIALGFVDFLETRCEKEATHLTVTVGHDSRISATPLKNAILTALIAKGVQAIDCALSSTPAMFMSTMFDETAADGAIMLTASHLPFNRNGMKFFTKTGGLEHEDIDELLTRAAENKVLHADVADVKTFDLLSLYSQHLVRKIEEGLGAQAGSQPLSGMHIVVDAGNGSGGFFATKVLLPLGADISGSQFLAPDGMFPNHIPNPENKAAMDAIRQAVLNHHADLGLIFDTDVDRMSAVLPDGKDISRNALIAMMAAILAPDYPKSTIITDSVTSDELETFLEDELKLKHHRYMRGYKNVINECIRLNKAGHISPLAIETSGHGALSENYFLDDGAYLAVKLLIAAAKAKRKNQSLTSLIERLKEPAESREYRLKIQGADDFRAYGNAVLKRFEERAGQAGLPIKTPSYEGVRLVFSTGWALLRLSLHDPNMPLNVESREVGGVDKITKTVKTLLEDEEHLDISIL